MKNNKLVAEYFEGIRLFLQENKLVKAYHEVDALQEYLAQCEIKFTSGQYKPPAARDLQRACSRDRATND